MKKLLTLLIATGAFVAVHAQSTRDEARKVILGQDKKGSSTNREGRDVVLGGGNGNTGTYPNYPNSRTTTKGHKGSQDCKGKKGKGNNGHHYGWEKGKGNPHKGEGRQWKNKRDDDRDDD